MKKISASILLLISCLLCNAQNIIEENKAWRATQNLEFADSVTSPLTAEDRALFDSLPFFPIAEKFAVKTYLELTPDSKPFKMRTSTDRVADYRQYAIARFNIDDNTFELPVYQNLRLAQMPQYKNALFVPFTDLTNDIETYPGGRYLDVQKPEGDSLIIDFNKAYNPYCAYNDRYSCPIPPTDNHLEIRIEAGVLYKKSNTKKIKTPKVSIMK